MNGDRISKLTELARAGGMDCVAIMPGVNMVYLSGLAFHLSERPTLALFPTGLGERPALILPALEATKPGAGPVRVDWQLFPWRDEEGAGGAFRQACEALRLGGRVLAVEEQALRVLELELLQAGAPGLKLAAAEPLLAGLRMRKSADELAHMRRAAEIAEAALADTLAVLRSGMTERQVAAELQIACLRHGTEGFPFEPLVLAGANSALPHGATGDQVLQAGQLLLFDFGASAAGYASDITRTFALGTAGELDGELRKVYDIVLAANEAGRAAARPGVPIQAVDRAARAVIARAGYGHYFTHRLGHGLGLSVHEPPYACEGDQTVLEEGMVFTVEPGIYLPGKGGVRIEDDVVITAAGCESLTSFERGLRFIP
ncbi:MAG: aminopeptidase P family protein [Thermoflexales bacterium]|nr:aminopeptidase P family protein [Thermoflexales bacterium]